MMVKMNDKEYEALDKFLKNYDVDLKSLVKIGEKNKVTYLHSAGSHIIITEDDRVPKELKKLDDTLSGSMKSILKNGIKAVKRKFS